MTVFRLALLPSLVDPSADFEKIGKVLGNLDESAEVVQGRFDGAPYQASQFLQSDSFVFREVPLDGPGGGTVQRFLKALAPTTEETEARFTLIWNGQSEIALNKITQILQSRRDLVCFNERKTFFLDETEGASENIQIADLPRCMPLLSLHNMLLSDSLLRQVAQLPDGTIPDRHAPIMLAELAKTRIFSRLSHFNLPPRERLLSQASALDYYRERNPGAYEALVRYATSPQGVRETFRGRSNKNVSSDLVDLYFGILVPHVSESIAAKTAVGHCAIASNLAQALLDRNSKWGLRVIQRILDGEVNQLKTREHDFSGAERALVEPVVLEAPPKRNDVGKTSWMQRFGWGGKQAKEEPAAPALAVRQTNFPGRSNAPCLDFSFSSKGGFGSHVDGWNFVMQSFLEISGHNPDGLGFDSFLEKTYVWGIGNRIERRVKPWIGISHRPFNIPNFYDPKAKLHFFQTIEFLLDRDTLRGLITVGSEHGQQLQKLLNVPVETVLHPTNLDVDHWNPACLNGSTPPKLIQIGSWLRNMHGIFRIPDCDLPRALLGGSKDDLLANPRFQAEARDQNNGEPFGEAFYDTVEFLPRLDDRDYNDLLCRNVVFLDLYDATANNSVLECIARHTPIIVRRMPATVEYLGEQYPLFFDTLAEAGQKASDRALLLEAHDYLRERSLLPDFAIETFAEKMHAAVERINQS